MTVNPSPIVALAGQALTPTPTDDVSRNTGMGLAGVLEASWGRAKLTENHEAQIGTFSVYDADGAFATRDYRGLDVNFYWDAPGLTGPRQFFRGRVSDEALVPNRPGPRGHLRGATLELTCTGRLTELGNRLTGAAVWPAESGAARMARLAALAAPTVATIDYRDYWDAATMAEREVDDADVLSLLYAMFDTAGGDRLNYDPQSNVIGYVSRRRVAGATRRAFLAADAESGRVIARATHAAGETPPPMIDGNHLEGEGKLLRSVTSWITRVSATYTAAGGVGGTVTALDAAAEAALGRRALALSTELDDPGAAQTAATEWFAILREEATMRQPEPVTYRADRAGGFPSLEAALVLIGGVERGGGHVLFVSGTPWAQLGVPPCFGLIGGTVRYLNGGWQPTLNLAPVFYPLPAEPAPIRVGQALAGTAPVLIGDLAQSLKCSDMRYVSA